MLLFTRSLTVFRQLLQILNACPTAIRYHIVKYCEKVYEREELDNFGMYHIIYQTLTSCFECNYKITLYHLIQRHFKEVLTLIFSFLDAIINYFFLLNDPFYLPIRTFLKMQILVIQTTPLEMKLLFP